MLETIGAGPIAFFCGTCMYLYMKYLPPGIAFTYCWLFYSFLSTLVNSTDGLALSFCIGFGLNISWYASQLVDSLLWSNLIPYWDEYFPHWCIESLIRIGDIFLHPLPFYFLLPYHRYVDFRIGLYAFLLERWYFILVEGQPFGTGCTTNIIYDFRPHLPRRTFLLSQYLTNLGYLFTAVSQINSSLLRILSQAFCCGLFLFVCIIHTDRWNHQKNKLPKFSRKYVGSALTIPVEPYTLVVNSLTQQLHAHILDRVNFILNSENKREFLLKFPKFSSTALLRHFTTEAFWKTFPEGLFLSESGIVLKQKGDFVLLWDTLIEVYASLALKLHLLKEGGFFPQFPLNLLNVEIPYLEVPSLELFQAMLPNTDISDLAFVRTIIEALRYMAGVVRPLHVETIDNNNPIQFLSDSDLMKNVETTDHSILTSYAKIDSEQDSKVIRLPELDIRSVLTNGTSCENQLTVPNEGDLPITTKHMKEVPSAVAAWREAIFRIKSLLRQSSTT